MNFDVRFVAVVMGNGKKSSLSFTR